jgi:curved DNA-binding protein CbpA
MNKPLDPYAELGVERNASEEEVKAAFKARAKKAHPDLGGSTDAFYRAKTAMVVLTDPDRRARFDATGAVEDEKPDNVRAAALQIIQKHMADIVTAFMTAKTPQESAAADPRKMNVPVEIERRIAKEIAEAQANVPAGEKMVEFLRDMRRRFKAKAPMDPAVDPILRGYDDQIRRCQGQLEQVNESIRCREKAVEIIRGYDFEADPPWPSWESVVQTGWGAVSVGP